MAKAPAARKRTTRSTGQPRRIGPELAGLLFLFLAAFLFVAVFTFDIGDPTFNQSVSAAKVHNLAGSVGSHAAGFLVELFGAAAYAWPFFLLYLALSRFISALRVNFWRWLGLIVCFVCITAWLQHPWLAPEPENAYGLLGGGVTGRWLNSLVLPYLRPVGSILLWVFLSLAGIQVLFRPSWTGMGRRLRSFARDQWAKHQERKDRRARLAAARRMREPEITRPVQPEQKDSKPAKKKIKPVKKAVAKPTPAPAAKVDSSAMELPPLDLLALPPENQAALSVSQKELQQQAQALTSCLAEFGVAGEITRVVPGPVVTQFEFKPAPGVKVSRIAALSDDIALALRALAVRVEAPIPGKDTVGVEIPSKERKTVFLREVLSHESFQDAASPLTLALGKDIQGRPRTADLARMPHLLVAGATGKGKSVFINTVLLSFLYKAPPEDLRLLLIDPKRIELSAYADLPHLVHPVVTDMSLARSALDWAVAEMDRRYQAMAEMGVKNIEAYNLKVDNLGPNPPEELAGHEKLPYLVLVIDELADLMMTAAKEVEGSVVRLAQLARAAGIHMVLATQRPSVDVVTGLIKANFPTRIAFETTSRHDSRTILDTVGAEKLLGDGDMLHKPGGGRVERLHGAFVRDREIAAVTKFWKAKRPAEFAVDFEEWAREDENGVDGGAPGEMNNDPMYREAVEFVLTQGKASISLIQRRFRIGFNRAARYIEQMETDGMLGPQEGSKPRKVIAPK